jgi:acetoin utilization deacetylase AcuC-like enzyme
LKAHYSDRYVLPLPEHHRFPMQKYERLRRRVERELPEVRLAEPPAATDGQLALAHDAQYIERVAIVDLDVHQGDGTAQCIGAAGGRR